MGFVLVASSPRERTLRMAWTGEARVGRSWECDLVLRGDGISRIHARFFEEAGRVHVADLASVNGTSVNGRLLSSPAEVGAADVIAIGSWTLKVEPGDEAGPAPFVGRTPRERELVAALAADPRAEELRLVYADWLEENGFAAEAELLALERVILAKRADGPLGYRLRLVAASTDVAWRALATRPAIEGCDERMCPTWWPGLAPTKDAGVRRCTVCAKEVRFARSVAVALEHRAAGRIVVVDPALLRAQDDLSTSAGARVERSETMRLPFFARGARFPRTVPQLCESLRIDALEENARPPLTPLVHQLTFSVDASPDATLRSFRIEFRAGVDDLARTLRRRYGPPREVRAPPSAEGEASRVYGVYGGLLFRRHGERAELGWESKVPDWMAPRTSDPEATLAFLGALASFLRRGPSRDDVISFASRPPAEAGLRVYGPTGGADFWIAVDPPLPALEVTATLAIREPVATAHDARRMFWDIHSNGAPPAFGPWSIKLLLERTPQGVAIAKNGDHALVAADRVARALIVGHVIERAPLDA